MPIQIPVTQTGLEASIEAAAKKAGRSLKVNMGPGAKSIEGLSQPLGRITGKADQFTKSMEAANARVLAFGASVGVLSAVTKGFKDLVSTTIEVEKSLASINSILQVTDAQLNRFKKTIFDVARNTEQSFDTVATAALELSRQGLKAEEVTKRLNDSLILARLSGLGASEAVAGLTAAINSFNSTSITSEQVLNKLSSAAASAAVSERDLIEGIKRSGSVAIQAGVSFDELVGVITAVQKQTARGGAVIGNSFKTIFTRIQSLDKLKTMQNLGVQVTDASGEVLSATKLIQNLANTLEKLPKAERLQIAEGLVGKFQIAPFLAILEDYNKKTSTAIRVTEVAANATNEAYNRNIVLNDTLAASINAATVNLKELAEQLGKIGVTDSLKNILDFFNSLVGNIREVLEGEGLGSDFARGLVKGIGNVLSGPGLAIFGAIIAKLTIDLAKFGVGSLQTFFGLNRAAKEQATLQGQIASTLLNNEGIQKQILAIENSTLTVEQKRAAQTKFFTTALNEQLAIMTRMQAIAARVTPGVFSGTRGKGRAAGGYIPNFNAVLGYGSEQAAINKGVGGAPKSAKPVTIPNFNFGGGQRGTVVANNSEFMVPNFAGTGGSAIFNQDMVNSMGLPAGAKKIGAAGGYIPNFAAKKAPKAIYDPRFAMIVPRRGMGKRQEMGRADNGSIYKYDVYGIDAAGERARETPRLKADVEKFAINEAIAEAGFITGGRPKKAKIDKLGNQGSIGSLAGSIFETALSALIKSPDFDAFGETARFDYVGPAAVKSIADISPSLRGGPVTFLEAKIRENDSGIRKSMANKIAFAIGKTAGGGITRAYGQQLRQPFKEKGKATTQFKLSTEDVSRRLNIPIRNRAGGYIPSFASPLEDAISRESAAGLPINQIRINQSPKLRNSGNPMGLAVTNMRDEPTGAIPAAGGFIPNFRKGGGEGGFANMVSSMLGLQIAFSMLTPIVSEVSDENEGLIKTMKALNVAMIGLIGIQALGQLGPMLKGLKGIAGTFRGTGLLGGGFRVGKGGLAHRGTSLMMGRKTQGMFAAARKTRLTGAVVGGTRGAGLAAKGLGQGLLGGLRVAGGALLRFAGPIGLAATAVFAGVKAYNKLTGATDSARKAEVALADAAKIAARELNELEVPQEFKQRMTESAQSTAKAEVDDLRRRGMKGTGDSGRFDDMEGLLAKALGTGADTATVLTGLRKITLRSTGKFKADEVDEITKYLQNVVSGTDADRTIRGLFNQMSTEDLQTMKRVSDATADRKRRGKTLQDDMLSGDPQLVAQVKERRSFFASMRESAMTSGGVANISGEAFIASIDTAGMREYNKRMEEVAEAEEKIAESSRVSTQQYQERLKHSIAMMKAERSLSDSIDEQITLAEKLGNKSEAEISDLKKKKIQEDAKLKSAQLFLETQAEIASLSKKLDVDEKTELAIMKQIADARADGVIDSDEQLKITKSIQAANRDISGELIQQTTEKLNAFTQEDALLKKTTERLLFEERITEQARIQAGLRAGAGTDAVARDAQAGFETRSGFQAIIDRETADQARLQGQVRPTRAAGRALEQAVAASNLRMLAARQGMANLDLQEGARSRAASLINPLGARLENLRLSGSGVLREVTGETLTEGRDVAGVQARLREIAGALDEKSDRALISSLNALDAELTRDVETLKERQKADTAAAEAARDFAGILKLATQSELFAEMKEDFLVSRNKDLLSARLETDPVARIKANIRNNNFDRRMAAKTPEQIREIVEEEQFAGTLIDASVQFANNIGDAMIDAIAKGESLGDTLRSAASDFFLMLSKAFMQKAINNLVGNVADNTSGGGGTGILGGIFKSIFGFNSGGRVSGGSGNRDDVPALLTGGEFVMNKGAVKKYGPAFMMALNSGSVPTMNRGGMFTPGSYGQGAITGKSDLFNFATQGFTMGGYDRISGGSGFASIALEPLSARMTRYGIANSPQAQREKASQQQALGLYFQQLDKEKQMAEQAKQQKGALKGAIMSAIVSGALMGITGGMGKGKKAMGAGDARGADFTKPANFKLTDLFTGRRNQFGGSTDVYGNPGVLPLKNNNLMMAATGGSVPYTAGVDTVPAMLSGGEFVMNAAATQNIGRGNLAALNSGARGGNGEVVGKLDELIEVSGGSGETVINITVNSDGSETEDGGQGEEQKRTLAMRIKDTVKQVIEDEKRLGGSLRQAKA